MKKTISQRFFLSLCLMIVGCLWGSAAWAETITLSQETIGSLFRGDVPVRVPRGAHLYKELATFHIRCSRNCQ